MPRRKAVGKRLVRPSVPSSDAFVAVGAHSGDDSDDDDEGVFNRRDNTTQATTITTKRERKTTLQADIIPHFVWCPLELYKDITEGDTISFPDGDDVRIDVPTIEQNAVVVATMNIAEQLSIQSGDSYAIFRSTKLNCIYISSRIGTGQSFSPIALCFFPNGQLTSLQQHINTILNLSVSSDLRLHVSLAISPSNQSSLLIEGIYMSPFLLEWALSLSEPFYAPSWLAKTQESIDKAQKDLFSGARFLYRMGEADSTQTAGSALQTDLGARGLRTVLRPYQLNGVAFMLRCLTGQTYTSSHEIGISGSSDGWVPLKSSARAPLYYNLATAEIRQFINGLPPSILLPQNCLLCDEMGLGKSLQVLCIVMMLKHRRLASTPTSSEFQQEPQQPAVATASQMWVTKSVPGVSVRSKRQVSANEIYFSASFTGIGSSIDTPSALPCLCGREFSSKRRTIKTIACTLCQRAMHEQCCGKTPHSVDADGAQIPAEPFMCLSCKCQLARRSRAQQYRSNGCLMIVPDTLATQWVDEISKHFKNNSFTVFVYGGCSRENVAVGGYNSVDPSVLAKYDIVIVKLNALSSEFHLANMFPLGEAAVGVEETELKRSSGYFPPPFLCIDFELIVVDETQKLDSKGGTSQILSMARRISARHKISVSGTPLGSNKLSDLSPLCAFLEVNPYDTSPQQWQAVFGDRKALKIPLATRVKWAVNLLQPLMIRRTKNAVETQLDLKRKQFIIRKLAFSTFERALYSEKANALKSSVSVLSSSSPLDTAKASLEHLRRGCCHPQLLDPSFMPNKSRRRRGAGANDGFTRSFLEIMLIKIEQMRTSCEESQRMVLFSLLSLAGNSLLKGLVTDLKLQNDGNSVGFEGKPTAHHKKLALRSYKCAINLIESNRAGALLVSVLVASGGTGTEQCEFFCPRAGLGVGAGADAHADSDLFHTSDVDGVPLRWIIPGKDVDEDGGDQKRPCLRDIESGSGKIGTQWDSVYIGADEHNNAIHPPDTPAPKSATIPRMTCKLEFNVSRRVLELEAHALPVLPIANHTKGSSAIQLDTIVRLGHCLPMLSSVEDTRNANLATRAYIFPETCRIYAQTGQVDSVECCVFTVPDPFPLPTGISEHPRRVSVKVPNDSYRARTWKVQIDSFRPHALLVRRVASSGGVGGNALGALQYLWMPLSDLEIPEFQGIDSHICLNLVLHEALLDVDPLQELHCIVNYIDVCRQLGAVGTDEGDRSVPAITISSLNPTGAIVPSTTKKSGIQKRTNQTPNAPLFPVASSELPLIDLSATNDSVGDLQELDFHLMPSLAQINRLEARAAAIESHYLATRQARKLSSFYKLHEELSKSDASEQKIMHRTGARANSAIERKWWLSALEEIEAREPDQQRYNGAQTFLQALLHTFETGRKFESDNSLADKDPFGPRGLDALSSLASVGAILDREWNKLVTARKTALEAFKNFDNAPTASEIARASNCKLCRNSSTFARLGPTCQNCELLPLLENFSKYLFSYRNKVKRLVNADTGFSGIGDMSQGIPRNGNILTGQTSEDLQVRLFNEGRVEGGFWVILRQLRQWLSNHDTSIKRGGDDDDDSGDDGDEHCTISTCRKAADEELARYALLQKELLALRALQNNQDLLLKAHDELDMCKNRLQLAGVTTSGTIDPSSNLENMQGTLLIDELGPESVNSFISAASAEAQLKDCMSKMTFYKNQALQTALDQQKKSAAAIAQSYGLSVLAANDAQDRDDGCTICQEGWAESPTSTKVFLPCAHLFHKDCLMQWFGVHKRCPVCKKACLRGDMQEFYAVGSEPSPMRSTTLATAGAASPAHVRQDPALLTSDSLHQELVGSWGTKVDRLTSDLLHLIEEGTGEKALVFSQWVEMLEIVAQALTANRIPHLLVKTKGKDFDSKGKIAEFKTSAAKLVLLLPLNLGAEGLDLIVANHIFLLEPLLNSAQEMQAINRCDRIGQIRTPTIHKYILADTVEDRILTLQQRNPSMVGPMKTMPSVMPLSPLTQKKAKRGEASDQINLTLHDLQQILE